jgi:hypothetical protein
MTFERFALLACAALIVGSATRTARSEPAQQRHPRVMLDVNACARASEQDVRRIVGVELGALLTDDLSGGDVTRVTVTCEAGHVRLRVDDPITGKSLKRDVDLVEDDASARARLVALAVAELVVTSWTELETNPEPQVPPAGPRPTASAVQAARETVQVRAPKLRDPHLGETRISAVVSRRSFFSEPEALWGGGVSVGRDQFPSIGWTVDVLAEHGETSVSLGKVAMDTFTAGASLVLYRRWSVVVFQMGLGLRAGAARLSGTPSNPSEAEASSGVAPWGWPTATAGLRLHPVGPLVIALAGETGYVVLPMSGAVQGKKEITVEGPWIGTQLSFGLTL